MWIFILFLTIFQGLSTYLMSISIAQIKLGCKSINKIILNISPYKLLEYYTPEQMFNNMTISILSRGLLFITGCTGILLCLSIHDIYYRTNKHRNLISISNKETTEVLHEILDNGCDSFNLINYPDKLVEKEILQYESNCNQLNEKINFVSNDNIIDLLIDSTIVENGLDVNDVISYLTSHNIICKRIAFINKSDKYNKPYIQQLMNLGIFYYISTNNIDEAIFSINKDFPCKPIEQTICLCLKNDYDISLFKHLCVPVNINNLHLNDYHENIANKISKLIND